MDQSSEDTTHSLDTKRKRSNIKKKNILDVTGENSTLDSSSHSDGLIGVDTLVGSLTEESLNRVLNLGHSSHTSDKKYFINLILGKAGILEARIERL